MGNSFLFIMGTLIYVGCIIILSVIFRFLPKNLSKVKFILVSTFVLTMPFFVMLIIKMPPADDVKFFFLLPIFYSVLNGIYGAWYYKVYRSKTVGK